jgi:hypothetical protein
MDNWAVALVMVTFIICATVVIVGYVNRDKPRAEECVHCKSRFRN